jgi:hypothetical protein
MENQAVNFSVAAQCLRWLAYRQRHMKRAGLSVPE